MSRPAEPLPAKLVASLISSQQVLISDCILKLSGIYGKPDYISGLIPFSFTEYYEPEMGSGLVRRMISFEELIMPDMLPDIKITTNQTEEFFSAQSCRTLNIDPGYVTSCHLVLATGKPYAHRPYLRKGIYADLTLVFRAGSFQPLEWTYPDYAGPAITVIMNKIREKYLLQNQGDKEEFMIKSMTGFGRSESVLDDKKLAIEIKSLNHRFLETFVRLPGVFSALEADIKKKIGERFSRGRIEVTIRRDSEQSTSSESRLELNMPLIRNYHKLLTSLKDELGLNDEITLGTILSMRDAITVAENEVDLEKVWKSLSAALEKAMDSLEEMRSREGLLIYGDLQSRLGVIASCLEGIRARAPLVVEEYRRRLTERIKDLAGGVCPDDQRVAMEVAIMADRSDITEEIVRFQSHLSQMETIMKSNEPVGRKIDFLLQEMNREANTIGSKSPDAEISQSVVEIKTELSRLREQVQNIE